MDLPKDPFMLMSFINLKLRDFYSDLDELCEDLNIDKAALCDKLKSAGFEYSEKYNKFF